jgi:hypothetical protein
MVEGTPGFICKCMVVHGKIQFCARHPHAETLFQVCWYVRNFLISLQVARLADEKLIRKIILPYITDAIDRASKDQATRKVKWTG